MARRITLTGVMRGRRIELDGETGIPDGTRVQVTIEAPDLTFEEKRAILDRLCGVWADDPGIERMFKEIAQDRRTRLPRPVDFDGTV